MNWTATKTVSKLPSTKDAIFIEGLPGIGNVGKVAVDFLIEEIKAKKIMEFFSYTMPHSVFVNEENLVELPSITLFHKRLNKKDILILTGDVQPTDEISSYELTEKILEVAKKFKTKEMITTGGIGLSDIPKNPKVYCTGNNKTLIQKYIKQAKVSNELYGIVGPIIGVSGLLLGLGEKVNIKAVALLAETLGHPAYLGIKGAREILKALSKVHGLKLDFKKLEKEITNFEKNIIKKTEDLHEVSKKTALGKVKRQFGSTDYIG